MEKQQHRYDIAIIGAGASGTALAYMLSAYTNIKNIILIEKYEKAGQVNSKASNNSQTLHVGDIETNYSLEKVRQVKPAAMMIAHYAGYLAKEDRDQVIFPVQKMVLGVGADDVAILNQRFKELKSTFPDLEQLDWAGIARVEPLVIKSRDLKEPVTALFTKQGYAVNFEKLSESFIKEAQKRNPTLRTLFGSQVKKLQKQHDHYLVSFENHPPITAPIVIVDADSYSLLLAKQLGYGKHYSLIPIAGSFYFSEKMLNGKVYTVQEPKLPFAAVHGDPDILVNGKTRWGPTARFHPVLESRKIGTSADYLKSSGLHQWNTWKSFFKILLDPVRFKYLLENMLYELPIIGDFMFLKHVKKIIPSIKRSDLKKASDYGGMRLQRVDTNTQELQLGEGKIIGDNIIFNMTPSPGASVCLYNAMRDIDEIIKFSGNKFTFNQEQMYKDLLPEKGAFRQSVSIPAGYAS